MNNLCCPVCSKEIVLSELEQSFIDGCNKVDSMFGHNSFFFRRGSGIRRVCENCNSKLELNWKTQAFERLNWFQKFFFRR
ncbi:MAG: hypothetical protein ISS45_04405 [Candidatus Omnitrophica bacterium]|nr:hypothetical protein [Candidatus Omnitrophota bacterium]